MSPPSRPLPAAAKEAIANGRKIEAIKIVRKEWGLSLTEAKEVVDGCWSPSTGVRQPKGAPTWFDWLCWLATLTLLVGTIWWSFFRH